MASNVKFIKCQFRAKHSTVTHMKLQRSGDCLDAMCVVREIQHASVVTSNMHKRFVK